MDVFKTPGAFSWSELSTTDPEAAVAFYSQLFGWKVEAVPMPDGTYHVAKIGDAAIAGIMKTPSHVGPMPPAWGCYITVADVDASVRSCEALGGRVCAPPMDIPGIGRMAVLQDPQGAVINVMAYSQG